ncbi:MAG: ChbG/HpnK family deacetylase [bacterium]|nr:ChbG/HpnK family deacetylase [bacterium]
MEIKPGSKKLWIVADDFGSHAEIDEGIRIAAENGALTCADIMVSTGQTQTSLRKMAEWQVIPQLGIHIEQSTDNDYLDRLRATIRRRTASTVFRAALCTTTIRQIETFREITGQNPAHVSVHHNLHMKDENNSWSWFDECLKELNLPDNTAIRGQTTYPIRHNRAWYRIVGREPYTPIQFALVLAQAEAKTSKTLELIVHPAIRLDEKPDWGGLFPVSFREKDLSSLLAIIKSNVITAKSYSIEPSQQ